MRLWVLEYRTRKRRNSKWEPWRSIEPAGRIAVTAFREYPKAEVMQEATYERRAVEYVRKEPGETTV